MRFLLLLALVSCTITRYYQTKKFRPQLEKLRQQMAQIQTSTKSDLQQKTQMLEAAGSQARPLRDGYLSLEKQQRDLEDQTKALDGKVIQALDLIGTKKKIPATDPAFKELNQFEDESRPLLKSINNAIEAYGKSSQQFNQNAHELGYYWIDVPQFKQGLAQLIVTIDQQCSQAEGKLNEASAKFPDKRPSIDGMKGDIHSLRGIQRELSEFSSKFDKSTKSRQQYLVTPKDPQAKLFGSFNDVQARAGDIVKSFNSRVQELR